MQDLRESLIVRPMLCQQLCQSVHYGAADRHAVSLMTNQAMVPFCWHWAKILVMKIVATLAVVGEIFSGVVDREYRRTID